MKKDLLELDRLPTLDELKELFDWGEDDEE